MAQYKDKDAKSIAQKISKSKEIVDSIRGIGENEKIAAFQEVLAYLLNSENPSPEKHLTKPYFEKNVAPKISSSFAGFIRKLGIKSQADKVLAGIYACLQDGKKSITLKDIEDKYKEAFLKKSKNMNAEVNSNISKGYVMETDEKISGRKAYSITSDGLEHIEKKLKKSSDKDD